MVEAEPGIVRAAVLSLSMVSATVEVVTSAGVPLGSDWSLTSAVPDAAPFPS